MGVQKFRHAIFEAYYDPIADPTEFNSYSLAVFLRNIYNKNNDDFIKTNTRQKDQFYYNKSIKNKLMVTGDDFVFFKSRVDSCYKYWCDTYKTCNGGEVLISRTYFTQKNLEWDYDRCTAFIEAQVSTLYPCFDNNKSISYNIPLVNNQSLGALTPAAATLNHFPGDTNSYVSDDLFLITKTVVQALACRGYEEFSQMAISQPVSDFFNWQKNGTFQGPYELTSSVLTEMVSPTPGVSLTPIPNYVNPGQDPYYIAISLINNIKNFGTTGVPLDNFKISFDDITHMMRSVFNVYWVLEAPNFIRFEHYSWFLNSTNYDATSLTNFKFNKFKNKFTYNKDEFPYKEEFTFTNGIQEDFFGKPIIYAQCSNNNIIERGFEKVSTDPVYIANNPVLEDMDGWVIYDLAPVSGGIFRPRTANGYISGTPQINGRLSKANFMYDLHRHGRPFDQGIMNDNLTSFFPPIFSKLQDSIIVQQCCEQEYPFEDSLVRTELGDGLIIDAEINYTKETITFKLKQV